MRYDYIINKEHNIDIGNERVITSEALVEAINFSNLAIQELNKTTQDFDINIFEVLGMRNLSGTVGEYLCHSIQRFSSERLVNNPHQDGYPDLLLIDNEIKMDYLKSICSLTEDNRLSPNSKADFSPFKYGGIEVKATCGSTPPASKVPKPMIGEQRIRLMNKFDWKAHHRDTNNLVGIIWDFINKVPTIVACFYRNDLTESDWGNIVQPKKGGGRTTSVSIMNAGGIKKMAHGWIAVIDDSSYIEKLSSKKWIGKKVK